MDMKDDILAQEIAAQNAASESYETIRYQKDYSLIYQNSWFREMVSFISQDGSVLDNGCGVGHLAEFLPTDNKVGFDISSEMLIKAGERLPHVVRGNSQHLPFGSETFDIIFCRALLHHLQDPQAGIDEMSRVLKKGGEIIIAEPIKSVLSTLPRKLVKGKSQFSDLHKDFERNQLIEIVRRKFSIEEIRHFGYIAYPVLGFPDVVDPFKYVPFKKSTASFLISLDKFMSRVPILSRQSWGIIIKAVK